MNFIKKTFLILLFTILLFFSFSFKIDAKEVNVYIFYGKTCPHCEEAREYLNSIKNKYDLNLVEYEVWNDTGNKEIMNDVADYLDINVRGVPFVVIDNTPIIGYSSNTTNQTYIFHINKATKSSFVDKVGIHLGLVDKENNKQNKIYEYNLFGKDLKKINILSSTMLLGLLDAFSISMFWGVLLISILLINIKDKKKAFIVGISSIMIMMLFYFLLLVSGIKYDIYLNLINGFRILTSVLLIILGIIGLIKILKHMDNENNIKGYVKQNNTRSILITLLSFMLIIGVVLISLMNHGGVPDIILNVLKYHELSFIIKVLLLIIYILIITLIYTLFYILLQKIFIKLKLYESSNETILVISSIMILFIGILLGLKPLWLTFNF